MSAQSKKKTWLMPVTWEMCATIQVEAETLEEAMEIAKDEEGRIPLPIDGVYVDASWDLSSSDKDYLWSLQDSAPEGDRDADGGQSV